LKLRLKQPWHNSAWMRRASAWSQAASPLQTFRKPLKTYAGWNRSWSWPWHSSWSKSDDAEHADRIRPEESNGKGAGGL